MLNSPCRFQLVFPVSLCRRVISLRPFSLIQVHLVSNLLNQSIMYSDSPLRRGSLNMLRTSKTAHNHFLKSSIEKATVVTDGLNYLLVISTSRAALSKNLSRNQYSSYFIELRTIGHYKSVMGLVCGNNEHGQLSMYNVRSRRYNRIVH